MGSIIGETMSKKKGLLVIQSAMLTAKTKAGRDKQWKKIMDEGNRFRAAMEKVEGMDLLRRWILEIRSEARGGSRLIPSPDGQWFKDTDVLALVAGKNNRIKELECQLEAMMCSRLWPIYWHLKYNKIRRMP
jgi:hypothetical protein